MKDQLAALISLISSGCMTDDEIGRVAAEAAEAYADPQAFLQANPDINYDDSFPIPLGEWVVVGSLPETVLFQADDYQELFTQIVASFGDSVTFVLKPKQLAKTEPLTALNRWAAPGPPPDSARTHTLKHTHMRAPRAHARTQ